jgi:molybdate transport system substrate-binding protein
LKVTASLLVSLALNAMPAVADEVRVMTSGAFTAAYQQLIPQCESVIKDKFVTVTTSMGTGAAFIPTRLQKREPADIVIIDDAAIRQLIKNGLALADSRTELARSSIGMAVRAGARKPDISSVAALKQTLLEAKSIAYSASVSGIYLTTELFPRLGIGDQVRDKSRRVEGERVGNVVARGEAEIGFQQISELLPIAGIDYVGPLPSEVQRTTLFSAAVPAHAPNTAAARAAIACLASAPAAKVVAKTGLEPITQK